MSYEQTTQEMNSRLMNEKKWICDRKMGGLILSGTFMMAGEMIVMLANTVISGQMLGAFAMSAVNLFIPIYSLIGFVAVLISIGSSVFFSQETGRFNQKGANDIFSQGAILSIFIGIVAFLVLLVFKDIFVTSVADTDELRRYVTEYYEVMILTALEYPLLKVLSFIIYSDGGELYSTLAYIPLIFGSIIISILSCAKLGMRGIAMGTVISELLAILVLLSYFFSKKCTLKFRWYVNLKEFVQTLRYSIADAGALLCSSIMLNAINIFFVNRFGSEKLPVLSTVVALMEIVLIFDGIGVAIQPILSTYRGENNMKSIRHLMGTATKYALVEGIIVTAIVVIFPGILISALGITDPQLYDESVIALRIYGSVLTVMSLMLLASSYHLFMDRMGLVLLNIGLKDCIMPIACVFILGSILGVRGVWIGFAVANIVAFAVLMLIILLRCGKKGFPLYLDTERDDDQLLLNILVNNESISWATKSIVEFAKEHGASSLSANKAGVSAEEVLVLAEHKKGMDVYAEILTDTTGDEISIIIRDTGEPRMQDKDGEMPLNAKSNGLSAYVMQTVAMSAHRTIEMASLGMNRINLVFKK